MTELFLTMIQLLGQLLSAWINFIKNDVDQLRNKG